MKVRSIFALGIVLAVVAVSGAAQAASTNGIASDMPAYYDDKHFTINFKELSANTEITTLRHNHSINIIYMSVTPLPENKKLIALIQAIQSDGINPLCHE